MCFYAVKSLMSFDSMKKAVNIAGKQRTQIEMNLNHDMEYFMNVGFYTGKLNSYK